MSRFGEEERWKRLVSEFNLTHDEEDRIHRHLESHYQVEKADFTYEELKKAAAEVVSRIR